MVIFECLICFDNIHSEHRALYQRQTNSVIFRLTSGGYRQNAIDRAK